MLAAAHGLETIPTAIVVLSVALTLVCAALTRGGSVLLGGPAVAAGVATTER